MLLLGPALSECSGWQSALDPRGPHAEHLAWLFWVFTILLGIVWLAVVAALAIALLKRAPLAPSADPLATDPRSDIGVFVATRFLTRANTKVTLEYLQHATREAVAYRWNG